MKKENILLHFHIFKNAGTTIDWILKKNFGFNALFVDDVDNPGKILSMNYILDTLEQHLGSKSISSHQIRFPLPTTNKFQFFPILFIRHPIDRAFSIYHYKKKETDDSVITSNSKILSLNNFIKWLLESKQYWIIKNFQILFLSKSKWDYVFTSQDLELSKQILHTCSVIGVVDRMDESLVVAEEYLRQYFPNIDMTYVKQNVSRDTNMTLDKKIEQECKELDKDVVDALHRENHLDLNLYKEANKELDRRINTIIDFDSKLSLFKERCKHMINSN